MLIPNITNIDGIWRGNLTLDSWNNFFNKEIDIDLNIGGDKLIVSLNPKHKLAYEYLVTNQEKILRIILNSLLAEYSTMQEEYGYEDEELDEFMPNVDNIQKFKEIMKPKRVYILDVENDGMVYLGFHFTCSWDEDHDYGVMMHKERVVKIGDGDVAFLSWLAEEDKKQLR